MLNAVNQRNLKRLIRFLAREDENGYIFAYAEKTAQIKGINATIQQHFEQNNQKIGIFFYNKYQDVTLIEQLKIFNKEHKYQGIIVANLYEPLTDTEHARRNTIEINFAREQFHALNTPIIFWITQEIYPQLINKANDLYTQRRLPSIVFEAEHSVTQHQEPAQNIAQDQEHNHEQEQKATTSTKLKIVEQQFNKALTLNLSDKELVNDYLIDYLIELSAHQHKQKVLTLYQKHQSAIKELAEKNSQQLGKIFDNIHEYTKAIDYYSLYIKTHNYTHLQLALTLISRSDVYEEVTGMLINALKDAETAKETMVELRKQSPKNKDYIFTLGMAQSRLGDLHKDLGNLTQALGFFEDNLLLTKNLFEDDPNSDKFKYGLAISYGKLGEIHKDLDNLSQALQLFEDDLKLTKELFEDNPDNVNFKYGLAISYEKLGDTHKDLGNLSQALQFFEDDLKLTKELFEGNPSNISFKNGLAISYEKLGDTHKDLDNLSQALQFFEGDLKLTKELFEDNPNNVSFKNGLAISYEKLGDTHKNLGNLNQALQFFKDYLKLAKELFEGNPNNVRFKNGLAISYFKLGEIEQSLGNDKKQMLHYFILSRDLLIELNQQHPDYAEFKNNLDEVDEILKGLQ